MSAPNFMCIGTAKSGTTSLYNILKQHSEIYLPSFKEPHFFDITSTYQKGLKWYIDTYFNNVKQEKCIGDFTPTYLFESESAKRIYNDLGSDVKFIVILRNPVHRAYSHYLHSKRDLHEDLSFTNAIKKESQRIKQGDYLSRFRFSYISQGRYYNMLLEYFKFFPKENFLIINFEDEFLAKRNETISKVLSFLEISSENINVDIKSNQASEPRSKILKNIMRRDGGYRRIIKKLFPSSIKRQIIKNIIQRLNLKSYSPPELRSIDKKVIFDKYFRKEVNNLEKLINRKMNWDQ